MLGGLRQHQALARLHAEFDFGEGLFAFLDDVYLTSGPERTPTLVVLGSRVGTCEFIAATLEEARVSAVCAAPRWTYLLRSVPPADIWPPLQLRTMKRCWSAWAGCSRGRIPRLRYRQPARGRTCHCAWGVWVAVGCGAYHRGAQGVPPAQPLANLLRPMFEEAFAAAQQEGGRVRSCMAPLAGL